MRKDHWLTSGASVFFRLPHHSFTFLCLGAIRLGDVRLRDCEGQNGWHRRISPRWKGIKTEGPSVLAFPLRDIHLCLPPVSSISGIMPLGSFPGYPGINQNTHRDMRLYPPWRDTNSCIRTSCFTRSTLLHGVDKQQAQNTLENVIAVQARKRPRSTTTTNSFASACRYLKNKIKFNTLFWPQSRQFWQN